jgi:protein disulfide-isomerase-like protein
LKVSFIAVDCTKNKQTCEKYDVKGFPTIFYFQYGKNERQYEGGREKKDFIKFMNNPQDPNADKQDPRDDWLSIIDNEHVQLLNDNTFDDFINKKQKVLVMFYAPWCGHCKTMKPAYAEAAGELSKILPNDFLAAVDATKSPELSKRFDLNGFPTLKFFVNGKFMYDYKGGRSKDELVSFIRDPNGKKNEL